MRNIIYKCSIFMYKHSSRILACRSRCIVSFAKHKRLLGKTSSLADSITQHQITPVRLIYYIENEDVKEFKRYPSVLDITQDTIKEIFLSENPLSPEDWDNVKVEIMSRCFALTDENFDSILMQVLLELENLQLAQSFMDYLKQRNMKPNFVTLCKYMVLCSKNAHIVGQDVILETYERVISVLNTSVLDARMVEFLVQGLCATDKWLKSFDYTRQLPKSQLTSETLNALTCAALRNKNYKIAFDILNNWYRYGASPSPKVFEEYAKSITDLHRKNPSEANHYFTNLADYARSRNIIFKQSSVIYIEDYFKRSYKYSTAYSKVDRHGICSACKNTLEPCSLTTEEFSYLRNSFLEYSLKKSDIFINTTDSEFNKFYRFVEKLKPFDIVLDGLNVAFSGKRIKGDKRPAEQLFHVVNHLANSWNRILILGRYHMKKDWPTRIMRAIQERSYVFYVENISQDDPFLIYAALASGPNTILVSLDMMRDHISRLPDQKLIHLCKKWQQSHQVYLARGENENEICLMGPLKHNIIIQGSMESGWHIPFNDGIKREPYEELNNWLCVQKQINKAY